MSCPTIPVSCLLFADNEFEKLMLDDKGNMLVTAVELAVVCALLSDIMGDL